MKGGHHHYVRIECLFTYLRFLLKQGVAFAAPLKTGRQQGHFRGVALGLVGRSVTVEVFNDALLHKTPISSARSNSGSAADCSLVFGICSESSAWSASGVTTRCTCMRFSVSVPVLSVNMTRVAPKVALRRSVG